MPPETCPSTAPLLPLAEPVSFQNLALDNPTDYLVPGTNIIAVQACNASLSASSDFVIELTLSYSVDTLAPTWPT